MSPDPSVHEEQLAEIERTHREDRARRGPGCFARLLVLCFVILLGVVGWILWKSRSQGVPPAVEAGKIVRQVADEGRRLTEKPPEEIAAGLRQKIEDLKKTWSNHDQELDDLRQRAEALRTSISEHKQQAGDYLHTQYDDLRQRAEALAASARAQGEKVPAGLDDLLRMLHPLAGRPATETPAEATPTPKPLEKKP